MPGQSTIIFSVRDNTSVYTSSAFQYTADLYIWSGSISGSGSTPNYTLRKYPNAAGSGIFDFSRFVNDTNINRNFNYYKAIFNYTYKSGSLNITGSNLDAITTGSANYATYPGYYTDPNRFNISLNQQTIPAGSDLPFPLLTDDIEVTQSVINMADSGSYGFNSLYRGQLAPATQSWTWTGLYENGSTATGSLNYIQSTNSQNCTSLLTVWPSLNTFLFPIPSANLVSYKISSGSLVLNYKVVCPTKYPAYIIRFVNRYGANESLLCNLVSTDQFQGESKSFRPQMGDWNSSKFNYSTSESQNEKYISDGYEIMTLNTDWLDQKYNKIIKQLLVSDQISLYDLNNGDLDADTDVYPVELITNSLQLKTGVVNKLIQYTFQFRKNNYKLIL